MSLERLQKIIARAGITSRRGAEALISDGRVRVNGDIITELGAKADARDDRIEVDGKRISAEHLIYVLLHKPRNCVSTLSDPEGRPTVAEYVERVPARIYPVGRLDFGTSGVLLLTNDGDFTQGLLHPRKKVPKTYVVKLDQEIDSRTLERWREGVDIGDGRTLPAEVRIIRFEAGKTWLEVTLREGRNQQIRRMAEHTGLLVMRLARLEFAGLSAEGLRPGQWRALGVDELKKLQREYGVPKRVRPQPNLHALSEGAPDAKTGASSRRKPAGRDAPRTQKPSRPTERAGRTRSKEGDARRTTTDRTNTERSRTERTTTDGTTTERSRTERAGRGAKNSKTERAERGGRPGKRERAERGAKKSADGPGDSKGKPKKRSSSGKPG